MIRTSGIATILLTCSFPAVLPRVDRTERVEVEGKVSGIVGIGVAAIGGKGLEPLETLISEPKETGTNSES